MNSFEQYEQFVGTTAVYPGVSDGLAPALSYVALGLCGESGEAAEKIKKWLRKGGDLNKHEVIKELGDVLWYLTRMSNELGYSLADVAQINVDKLADRKARNVIVSEGDNR